MTRTITRRRRRAYYEAAEFPALAPLAGQWERIRDEAARALTALGERLGHEPGTSYILPLVPEPEDRDLIDETVCAAARALAPVASATAAAIPGVVGYAFSRLAPGKHIAPHYHATPYLNAILCLDDGGGGSYLVVDGQRHDFRSGEMVVFDYTLDHEAKNEGRADRIAMLTIFDPRRRDQRR